MDMRLKSLIGISVLLAASSIAPAAIADPVYPSSVAPFSSGAGAIEGSFRRAFPSTFGLADEFERVFFRNDKEFFNNRSIDRQLDYIFGIRNSFPENEINRDAEAIHNLYVDALEEQMSSDPVLRTPDLPNPYNNSLLQSPSFNVNTPIIINNPVRGSELLYEQLPPR